MNRDHFLYLIIGLLAGFISGYLVHESMSARQPAPLWHGAGQAAPGAPGAQAQAQTNPGQNNPGAGGGPMAAMEQVQRLRTYVEENPQDLEALRQLANMNYDIGNWQRAAELFERLLAQDDTDVDAMTDLGACNRNLGRLDDALALFKKVREVEPDHWQSRFNEVLILAFDKGDLGATDELLADLKRLQPGNPDVQRLITEVERRKGS